MPILEGLNPAQRDAVTTTEGPLLIVAGPGSGKTRVIVHRIAYLVQECGVDPFNIIAVTFTNKAAREVRERVEAMLGEAARSITLGTFHGVCARFLRIDGEEVGVPRGFAIYDDTDQVALVKRVMEEYAIDPRRHSARAILSTISRAKSELQTPESFSRLTSSYFEEVVARVFERYQRLLAENGALDFDDILVKTVALLRECPRVAERLRKRFRYVMIDEFQDTNVAQYALARLLAPPPDADLCVVGDPDQAIYSWRSADIRNILGFERDYPRAKVVHLEQNYRSTQTILDAAMRIIAANKGRKEKDLWTENGRGDPIVVYEAYNQEEEARYVATEIRRLLRETGVRRSDIAVMYRTNAQSRAIEERLVDERIPYRLVGGTRYYDRREVKDVIAYLRLVLNPFDSLSLERVINVPPRRIGEKTVQELRAWALKLQVPLYTALQMLADLDASYASPPPFATTARTALLGFLDLLNRLIVDAPLHTLSNLVRLVIEKTGYSDYLAQHFRADFEERWENVQELTNVAAQFDEFEPEHALMSFLEDAALMSDQDDYDERADSVTLITLHAAKGLEFPVVMIVGMEEGLVPHQRSFDDPAMLEEERRLCYVGVTRAKQRLYLVRAFHRALMGDSKHNPASRFLKDLPEDLVHFANQTVHTAYQQRRVISAGPTWSGPAREQPPRPRAEGSYAAGDHVRHLQFGEGIVVSANPTKTGNDLEVVVAFKGAAGVKKLLLSFAPLEKL